MSEDILERIKEHDEMLKAEILNPGITKMIEGIMEFQQSGQICAEHKLASCFPCLRKTFNQVLDTLIERMKT